VCEADEFINADRYARVVQPSTAVAVNQAAGQVRNTTLSDQLVWHTEDALSPTIRDRLIKKPELVSFPSEPTGREIAALPVIIARCGVPKECLCRLTIDDVHHADQGTGRKLSGPITTELIIEDHSKQITQIKVFLEVLSGVNQKPASMRASPVPGFVHLPPGTP
jgi:hypothetical protein